MLGGRVEDPLMDFCIRKALREAKDFCNVQEFDEDAEFYLVDWAAANYLTETDGYSKQWERLRKDAERGLISFRRMRW
jgi:hypothetical protein